MFYVFVVWFVCLCVVVWFVCLCVVAVVSFKTTNNINSDLTKIICVCKIAHTLACTCTLCLSEHCFGLNCYFVCCFKHVRTQSFIQSFRSLHCLSILQGTTTLNGRLVLSLWNPIEACVCEINMFVTVIYNTLSSKNKH